MNLIADYQATTATHRHVNLDRSVIRIGSLLLSGGLLLGHGYLEGIEAIGLGALLSIAALLLVRRELILCDCSEKLVRRARFLEGRLDFLSQDSAAERSGVYTEVFGSEEPAGSLATATWAQLSTAAVLVSPLGLASALLWTGVQTAWFPSSPSYPSGLAGAVAAAMCAIQILGGQLTEGTLPTTGRALPNPRRRAS